MVRLATESGQDVRRVEILSNLSLSLDELVGFFALLSATTLIVALLPALLGYWPILAIALLHLVLVGACLRLAWRRHWRREHVTIGIDEVRVERFSSQGRDALSWPSSWVRVELNGKLGARRLTLRLHGQSIDLATFVPESERLEAARLIRDALRSGTAWNSIHGFENQGISAQSSESQG